MRESDAVTYVYTYKKPTLRPLAHTRVTSDLLPLSYCLLGNTTVSVVSEVLQVVQLVRAVHIQ